MKRNYCFDSIEWKIFTLSADQVRKIPLIGRATISSLFVRFVLIIKGTILENFIVLHLNVLNLDLRPYFILFSALMSEMDLKQQMIYNYIPPFPAKCLGPPRN